MPVLAVALQVLGALALIIGAGFAISLWAALACAGVVALLVGDALEAR